MPDFAKRCAKIIEIVLDDELEKKRSREHYRAYRENNFILNTHQMGKAI